MHPRTTAASGTTLLVVVVIAAHTVKAIFQAGVYLYVTTGEAPPGLDADLVAGAFRRGG